MPDASAPHALPPLIPRSVLFGNPERADPQISPSGERLAFLAPVEGVLNVWVGSLEGDDARPITSDRDRGVREYAWAWDGEHLVYLQDRGGDENWRLYKVRVATGETEDLTPFEGVRVQAVELERHRPHELVFALNRDDPRLHDAWHLDLRTNALTRVAANPGDVVRWIPDATQAVRAALAMRQDGGSELRVRDHVDDEWRVVLRWEAEDALDSSPLAFTLDGRALLLRDSREANATRLTRLDLASGALEVLAADPHHDVGNVVIHPETRVVQMASFTRARREWTVLDASVAADLEAMRRVGRGDVDLHGRSADDRRWIVQLVRDDGPASFWCLDRATGTSRHLFDTRSDLAETTLARMEPIEYVTRDGLTVHGYLTLPPGLAPERLPLVLNVHGGPWARNGWGFGPEAQWLANRGYACLQVNFRGSSGYGKDFLNAGDREWGRKMHSDLLDGVRWAVERGTADPARVAIYGGSYGGYAALVGATLSPDVFRCAIDIVGPSNLITFIETIPPYWSSYLAMLQRRIGHPVHDREMLLERSPLTHADGLRVPLLIAQGANDPRVKQSESEQIVAALREHGIDHEYLLFPDEGHGFAKPANRDRFYAAAEAFLARHLGGRAEPA